MYDFLSNHKLEYNYLCVQIVEKLLIEMKEIEDIESECDIRKVLAMDQSVFHRDDILQLLIIFCKLDSASFSNHKEDLCLKDKLINLMIMLKEKNEDNFDKKYLSYVKKNENEKDFQRNVNLLLMLALKNGQKRAMETIVASKVIFINCWSANKSFATLENKNDLISLMYKYEYNVENFHQSWGDDAEYKDNLNARIIEEDQQFIKIDYKSFGDKNSSSICSQILDNPCMKNNITHPVLSMMINLEALSYDRFYAFNFWTFILIYIIPFYILLSYQNAMDTWWIWCIYILCEIGTFYLFIREITQLINIKPKVYFKKRSNHIEVVLIVVSLLMTLLIPFSQIIGSNVLECLSTLIIIFSTVEVLTLLPYPSMVIYMIMFKNVAITFWKFLLIFFIIIFAFAFSFFIVMEQESVNTRNVNAPDDNEKISNLNKLELETIIEKTLFDKFDVEESVNNNFKNIIDAILKTIQMISGEFTIEPHGLNMAQKLLFFFFVITSIILINFILGLVVDDIQNVRKHADFLLLKNQAEKTWQTASVINDVEKIFDNNFKR